MKIRLILYFNYFFLLFFVVACHQHSEEYKTLEKAAAIHNEAVKLEAGLRADLEKLIQKKNSINVQGRALTEEELQFVKNVNALESSHQFFTENHVEVPGFNHDHHHHDHNHNHSHDHDAQLQVTADDMLLIQKEFLDSIGSIQQRIQTLLK